MSILDKGCTCTSCMEIRKQNLKEARDKWNNGDRNILFQPYHYECGDGCCDEYGTNVYVNGFNLNCSGDDAESVVGSLIEFLNIDNVIIDYEYEEN